MNSILTLLLSVWPLLIKLVKVQYRTKPAEHVGLRFLALVFAKGKNLRLIWQRYIWQHMLLALS